MKTWIIKSGSSLLTNHGKGLDRAFISQWVEQVVELRKRGVNCILVSSGAVAEGLSRLGVTERPHELHELQAAAAVGQMGLIQNYEVQFQKYGIHTAQILLTHDDLSNRQRYLNARSTLKTLVSKGVVPIINENDTVAIDEIRFGDNDTLAALTANLLDADQLILLTDQDGLFTDDPRSNKNAKLVNRAAANDPTLLQMAGSAGTFGRGGMYTKIKAAQRAALSGTTTVIANGNKKNILLQIEAKEDNTGTWLTTENSPVAARKQWLAGHLKVKGTLTLDDGACVALKNSGKSLLPIGVKKCEGNFKRGEAVMCVNTTGENIAIGLINYNSDETGKIIGKASGQIEAILGYIDDFELIHRDNLSII